MRKILFLTALLFSFVCNAQYGATFHSLLSTGTNTFDTDGSVVTIASSASEASFLNPSQIVFSPSCLWANGKTLIPFSKRIDQNPYGQIGLIVYDERVGVDRPKIVGKGWPVGLGGDTHVVPVVGVNAAGNIYAMQQEPNGYVINNYKSQVPNDYEDFSQLTDVSTTSMYPNLIKKADGNFAMWNRKTVGYYVGVANSTSELESWGSNVTVTDRTIANTRHYVSTPHNPTVGTWNYVLITRRYDTSLNWGDFFILKTQDFDTFYNWEGSYFKSVTGVSAFTESNLDTNCTYFAGGSGTQYCIPVTCMSPQGSFYAVLSDAAGGLTFIRRNLANTAWDQVAITSIPDLVDNATLGADPQGSAALQMVAYSDSNIELLVRVDEGTYIRPQRWKSTDRGDTWTFIDSPFSTINDDFYTVTYPRNLLDIPPDRNFVLVASGFSLTSPSLYLKRAAFGTVQAEPGYTPAPVADLNDITNCEFHYQIETGKMNVTGSVVNSLTDQSGNSRTCTMSGSPVWDGVDALTFDGSNDFGTVTTTGLTALTAGTYITVVQSSVANFGITFTDNTATDQYIGFGSGGTTNANTINYSDVAAGYVIKGQKTTRDASYHIITYVVGNNKSYLYVDGVFQNFSTDGLSGVGRNEMGFFLNTIATINRITLGGFIRSSGTNVYAQKLKECAFYSRCLTQDERLAAEQMLAVKYGLTLDTNQYN